VTSRIREVFELTRVRVLELLREPEMIFWVFAFPVMLAMVLGYAFKDRGIDPVRAGVLVEASSAGAGAADGLAGAPHVEVVPVEGRDDAFDRLHGGTVDILVEGGTRLHYDPTRPEGETARLRVTDALQRAAGRRDPLELELVPVTETGSRYIDWLIPGLLGLNLMSTSIWGVGFALVEARQKKLIKRFLVTPMRKSSFLLSYLFSRLFFLVLEVALLVAFACWVLGVPFRGSVLAFGLVSVLGGMTFAGLGVLIASRVRTVEAASGLIYLSMMPMGLSSGVFFPYERFSEGLQPWIEALPLTALNDALRALMLDGAGLVDVGPQLAVQVAWLAVPFALGLAIFRWR